ncbi:putative tail tape measure protein [Brevundimonas phage vB_BpoS-Gurke]|uniref:Lysozyme n=1 Tax=Brevundimonas phage vB_BpoS-Gurke TaxID=2948599 RepID=A0A9E7N1Z4_9CAUD|nr:putative tail tape measure protein [Brevundimonas phage vB_BpoS-Gurke]
MDTQPLKLKIDSGQAQADLAALARALDSAGAAAGRMSAGLTSGMAGADRAIKGSMSTMERFAQTSALINKIKVNGDGLKTVAEFARVMNMVARTKEIEATKLNSWRKFVEMGALTSRLRMDAGAAMALTQFASAMDRAARARDISASKMGSWVKFIEVATRASHLRGGGAQAMVGMNMFAQAMDNAARARAIPQAKLKSWVDFITIAARVQNLKFNPQVAQALRAFGDSLVGLKAPGKASIDRLDKLFKVLANAKRIPSAVQIARDLDMVAAAAGRASHALDRLPMRLRASMGGSGAGMGRMMRDTATGADAAGKSFRQFGTQAESAGKRTYTLGERLRGLNHRFDLAYQAGTAFSLLFSSFTIGGMIKSVYDASVEMMKLDKAMLFSTKSFEGSKRASAEFIATVFDMGLALDQVAEPFGRFTISAGAVGMSAADSSAIFKSVTQTLQVVGASAEQTGYAMYGLTQMIQKGKVSSEEFNRQIGEQIPGNAEAGRRALEKMTGQAVTMQQFFKKMSLGEIMSPEFTKLWAQELNNMFAPLMGMIRDRPDVAINRLGTALTVFRVAIGKSGFVQEIGIQFNRLADMIGKTEDGVFKLNPKFQELADKLGRNLADAMRAAGDAMVWLATNFDKVLFVAKTVATLFIARTFLSWGQAAFNTASSIQGLTKALFGLKMAQDAVASSDMRGAVAQTAQAAAGSKKARAAAAASNLALTGADMASIIQSRNEAGRAPTNVAGSVSRRTAFASAGITGVNDFARPAGAQGSGAVAFGRRVPRAAMAADAAASGAGAAAASTRAAASSATAMSGLAVAGRALGAVFGVLGIAAVATGAALSILSDKSTEIAGVGVKFIDITNGALDVIGRKFVDWWNTTFNTTKSFGDIIHDMGRPMKAMVDSLIWMGEIIGDTVGIFINLGKAVVALVNRDWGGAKDAVDQIKKDWSDNNIFDRNVVDARTRETNVATLVSANERLAQDLANAESERNAREGARILAERAAAEKQESAAAMQLEAAKMMARSMETPTVGTVMQRIGDIVSGKFLRDNPKPGTGAGAAGSAGVTAATGGTTQGAASAGSGDGGDSLPAMRYRRTLSGKTFTGTSPEEMYMAVFSELNKGGNESYAKQMAEETREMARNEQLRYAVSRRRNGNAGDMALGMIRQHEGFRADRYWDVNAYRAGYGSDTITDPNTGRVSRVTANTRGVTRDQAEADLRRRVMTEFVPSAERAVGKEQWAALPAATQAALTSVTYNYGSLPNSVARAAKTGDTATIAQAVEALGVHNNGVNARRRSEEAAAIRSGSTTPGDLTGAGAAAAQGPGDDEPAWMKAWNKRNNDYKSLQAFLSLPDPASQAVGRASAMAEQLNDLAINDEKRIAEYGQESSIFSPENLKQIEKGWKRVGKEISDSLNPISVGNRKMKEQNDLLSLTLRGRGIEAEWQEKINDLREDGYDIPMMQDEAQWAKHINDLRATGLEIQADSLNVAKQQWEAERARGKVLEQELRLMETINEARLRVNAGGATRRDAYFADLVNQSAEGGSYEQKLANLDPAQLALMNQTADVQDMADRAEALRSMAVDTSELMASATMSASQQAFRSTYREALSALTGMTSASLAEMEAQASESMKGLASGVAKLREELENQPGFQRWVNALEPFDKRMQDIKGQFLDGLSEGITGELMGEDVDWSSIGKQIQREMMKASVDQAIGDVMGLFGIKRGGAQLSPDASATVEALTANHNDLKTALESASQSLVSAITSREDTREAQEAAVEQQRKLVEDQVSALRMAATALEKIASGLAEGGIVRKVFDEAAMDSREQAMALESGNGYTASGVAIPNLDMLKPTTQVATAPAPFDVQTTLDRVFNGLGLPPINISGATTDAADEAMIARAASRTGQMTPERALQGAIPSPSATLGVRRDTSTLFQRVGRVFGQNWGGNETDVRNATTAQATTAVTAGPIALAQGDAGASTGNDAAASALIQAAQALAAVPTAFGQVTSTFAAHLEKWGHSLTAFDEAIAKLASSGGGSGGGMPSMMGGGDATSGFTFEGVPFASDLTGLYADGGYVSGRGGPRSDDINARLSNGEFVINAAATAQNRGLLEAINSGKAYAAGGYVDGLPAFAGGGFFSNLGTMMKPSNVMSGMFGKGKNGKYDGPMSWMGQLFGKGNSMEDRMGAGLTGLSQIAAIANLLKKPAAPEKLPDPVKGVIGEHRAVTVDATEIAAHENPIASIINMGMNMLTGGTWGKVAAYRQMASSAFGAVKNAFADGGYVSSSGAGAVNWASLPHYAEGTPNTSGGMPAVVHPNEAIIPLSGGRKVPVDMSGMETGGGMTQVTSNITVIAPNPDAFRKSQGSIQRQQNRDMKRASTRNLN